MAGERVGTFRDIGMIVYHWEELEEAKSRRGGGLLEKEESKVIRRRSIIKLEELKRIFECGDDGSQEDRHAKGDGGSYMTQESGDI